MLTDEQRLTSFKDCFSRESHILKIGVAENL